MKIYTKTGDAGETSLFGAKRVLKNDMQVESYGNVDELTSFIGLLIAKTKSKKQQRFLTDIQVDLYQIMAILSGAKQPIEQLKDKINKIEQTIDGIESKLPKLTRFILPQGGEAVAITHITRTECRRAERSAVSLLSKKTIDEKILLVVIQYLNRLSDFFFVYARLLGKGKEVKT